MVFTLNNYTPEEVITCDTIACKYIVYGKEVGESGTPHLQGLVVWNNAKTFSAAKKAISSRIHLEVMKGTHEQAREYCIKDGNFIERGTLPASPKEKGRLGGDAAQERWKQLRTEARETGAVSDEMIMFMHRGLVKQHRCDFLREQPLPDTTEKMRWYYGPTGTGKSRAARTEFPDAYLKMCNKWWDGYNMQEVVIIEDFDKAHDVLCHHVKIWADRYKFVAEIKGDSMVIRPRLIIVTSNWHPNEIWNAPQDLEPILRRFHVTRFDNI